MQNLLLNPMKKDYVVLNGRPVRSDTVLDKAYFALMIPQGQWLYSVPGQGSMLYTLANRLRENNLEVTFSSMVKAAIDKQLVSTGEASGVTTANTETTPTGSANKISLAPSAMALSSQLNFVGV
jgi:hypothetical protein